LNEERIIGSASKQSQQMNADKKYKTASAAQP
jgi:hypothetical protein